MNGVLIIDKPAGLTSHDVVNRVRRILQQRSIGHLGTLDPMATGVLPLVTGSLTRLAQFYTTSEKCYEGTIRFGFSTDTYDAEGEPTSAPQQIILRPEEIESLAARFRGLIEQIPPAFSAKKIQGVPAYKLARKQKEVVLKPVQVEIKEFKILNVDADRTRFRARVTSGTYMRSVAHDMGQALGCGAHLESLCRTAVAEFTLDDAHTLDELANLCHPDHLTCHPDRSFAFPKGKGSEVEGPRVSRVANVEPDVPQSHVENEDVTKDGETEAASPSPINFESFFVHPRKLLPEFPSVTADEPTAARIRSGRTVNLPELSRARQVKVFAGQRELLAIATRIAGTLFHPKLVFSS
jgi:tRNA pseudouridine55 synthase